MINKILIVEDDIVFCKMLTRFLVKNGYDVADAQSASQAYNHLKKGKFDLAILDYKLPDESGIDILKRIKGDSSDTKVILITRFSSQQVEQEAEQEGADAYISKPIDPNDLLVQIQKM